MSGISRELENLCTDLRSEKRINRNKAIERILYLFNNAEIDVFISQSDTLKLLLTSLLDSLNKVPLIL